MLALEVVMEFNPEFVDRGVAVADFLREQQYAFIGQCGGDSLEQSLALFRGDELERVVKNGQRARWKLELPHIIEHKFDILYLHGPELFSAGIEHRLGVIDSDELYIAPGERLGQHRKRCAGRATEIDHRASRRNNSRSEQRRRPLYLWVERNGSANHVVEDRRHIVVESERRFDPLAGSVKQGIALQPFHGAGISHVQKKTLTPPTLLFDLLRPASHGSIRGVLEERAAKLDRPHWAPALEALSAVDAELPRLVNSASLDQACIEAVSDAPLTADQHAALQTAVAKLFPWRKGPFRLAGLEVDAEWRSDRKFERLIPWIPPLEKVNVLDVGCNNGYYLFRLAGLAARRGEQAAAMLGIDPSERFALQFELLQRMLQVPRCEYVMLGMEEVPAFDAVFGLVLCLGIVYHQRDPLSGLQALRDAMVSGGTLILESQTIPGEEPVALFAPERYAKARNVYFVPTPACLVAWAVRAGFREVRVVSHEPVRHEEQRQTELAPYESLADFLDPADPSKTVEGFPAPWRTVVVGTK